MKLIQISWSSAIYKYKSMPNKDICQILKVSYDDLDEIEKTTSIQIASFFKRESLETVKHLLVAGDFHPEASINMLIEKSLLNIENMNL
ncbi:hypothetical protein L6164_012170 [Bauhinia variegata]|uniref:Uncharacterized protein n=1 Tax=Bauhinia variegata TaxID=167791 RepID=A0ACB9P955_BAUVA|nr:hypothetical protein L6164_012170 [Bauhinia variegata]